MQNQPMKSRSIHQTPRGPTYAPTDDIGHLSEQFSHQTSLDTKPTSLRLRGRCKWFNRNRGFGFITPIDGDGSEAIFVHRSELISEDFQPILLEGEEVEYSVVTDKDDRPLAARVTFSNNLSINRAQKRKEDLAQYHPGASGIMTGRVKWYDDNRGYGFIMCDDARLDDKYRDVWVHHDDIASRIKSLDKGERVEFFIRIVRDRPKAVSVTGPHGRTVRGSYKWHQQMRAQIPPPIDINHYNDKKTYGGVVKWFNINKGFGYVKFDDTQEEIYVSVEDIQGVDENRTLYEGDRVEFRVTLDARQRPKACNVTPLNGNLNQSIKSTLPPPISRTPAGYTYRPTTRGRGPVRQHSDYNANGTATAPAPNPRNTQ